MLKKSYSKSGRSCRVTFKLPTEAEQAALLGEFNAWNPEANPMKRRKDGTFSVTVSLDAGQEYRFRYLIDGKEWTNDDYPDAVVLNRFGDEDCLVSL